jgi:hypothetical protein
MVESIENKIEFPQITILSAIAKLADIWENKVKPEVKPSTISNYFRKAGHPNNHAVDGGDSLFFQFTHPSSLFAQPIHPGPSTGHTIGDRQQLNSPIRSESFVH